MQKTILFIAIVLGILCFLTHPAFAYVINGYVDDWGINLSVAAAQYQGYLDSNLPSGGLDIDINHEDNADITKNPARNDYWWQVYPGWSWYNHFDAEAIYFDNDQTNAYIAIITGLKKEGIDPPNNCVNGNCTYAFRPGDIAIDVDGINGYEYGLNITDSKLYSVKSWKNPVYTWSGSVYKPWAINETYNSGILVDFIYNATAQNSHYVLEAKIPLNLLNLTANPGDPVKNIKLHWGMECGNDYQNLIADVNPVPEPASLSLLGLGLLGLMGLRKKKIT